MIVRKHQEFHDVQQTKKMVPFITCEVYFCQYVCELVFGVNILDFDFWALIDSSSKNPAQLCEFLIRVSLLDFCLR